MIGLAYMANLAYSACSIYRGSAGFEKRESGANLWGRSAIRLDYATKILHTAENILRKRNGPTTTKPKKQVDRVKHSCNFNNLCKHVDDTNIPNNNRPMH